MPTGKQPPNTRRFSLIHILCSSYKSYTYRYQWTTCPISVDNLSNIGGQRVQHLVDNLSNISVDNLSNNWGLYSTYSVYLLWLH